MASPAEITEGWPIAQIVLATFSGGVAGHLLNAVVNRRSRNVQDGRTVVAGSVEWANALHAQNVAISAENAEFKVKYNSLEERFEELEDRFDAQQRRNVRHGVWDEKAAKIIRENIDASFPDPPSLEVA